VAEALDDYGSDGEGRKPVEQSGLDTRVVLAVNIVRLMSDNLRGCPVPK
jgi:hypothetical protein